MPNRPSGLITGASSGIGAVYVDGFAIGGHDLVSVTEASDLALVESRLRDEPRVGILVNSAGRSASGGFIDQSADDVNSIVNLNAMAVLRTGARSRATIRGSW